MGLDISAYSGLVEIRPYDKDDDDDDYYAYWEEGLRQFWHNSEFPASNFAPLKEEMLYSFVHTHNFHAGSYSGYNAWREQLANLIGTTCEKMWADPKPGPFAELINFADHEGTLASTVSKKLFKDFKEWKDRAIKFNNDGWFYDRYLHWMKAFEIASDNGAVSFH